MIELSTTCRFTASFWREAGAVQLWQHLRPQIEAALRFILSGPPEWFATQNVTVMTTLSTKTPVAGADCVGTRP